MAASWVPTPVQNGDDFAILAKRYNTSLNEILKANGIPPAAQQTLAYRAKRSSDFNLKNVPASVLPLLIQANDVNEWLLNNGGKALPFKEGTTPGGFHLYGPTGGYVVLTDRSVVNLPSAPASASKSGWGWLWPIAATAGAAAMGASLPIAAAVGGGAWLLTKGKKESA